MQRYAHSIAYHMQHAASRAQHCLPHAACSVTRTALRSIPGAQRAAEAEALGSSGWQANEHTCGQRQAVFLLRPYLNGWLELEPTQGVQGHGSIAGRQAIHTRCPACVVLEGGGGC